MIDETNAEPIGSTPGRATPARGIPPAANPRRILRVLETGVPGLDAVLGGGLPEFSLNVIAGGPGAGKTTLAQQIVFANATPERPALYFTVLGEPSVKMLRYQQQFAFFEPALVGNGVQFVNLSDEVLSGDLDAVLARMTSEVERIMPGVVVVDSFRSMRADPGAPLTRPGSRAMEPDAFVQRLALHLTSWEVTSFLIGEYSEIEQRHPLFTIADGILWMTQATDRSSVVRQLQAVKVRGQEHMPGLHTFRITDEGLQVFPRIPDQQWGRREAHRREEVRLSTGVPGLDALMGGGIPSGDAIMLAGATGTGKSTFGMLFAAEGLKQDESVVVVAFEEYPADYLARLGNFGVDADAGVAEGKLRVTYLRPLDLSVDETLADVLATVREIGASRVIIDSLTGFEMALAPAFRDDFRESLYRLVGALTAAGVTVLMVHEAVASSADMSFTGERVSFMTDDIIVQRYVELDGILEKVLSVVKMRRSAHSRAFWRYHVNASGAVIGEPLVGYRGILSGNPEHQLNGGRVDGGSPAGLTEEETAVLAALVRSGEATVAALGVSVGASPTHVAGLLERLVTLGYIARTPGGAGEEERYRAVAQVPRG